MSARQIEAALVSDREASKRETAMTTSTRISIDTFLSTLIRSTGELMLDMPPLQISNKTVKSPLARVFAGWFGTVLGSCSGSASRV
ncbi:hypothetical protein WN72_09905 [Bradyrhizobium arachidis]|uniref:Uncharacterized protein n=1 Tax=Bradyrhizobium arachidis TaxID=858423 RepID=A0AAE7NIA5_9BRAD|nr:hypothetical protein WN72_09905 [Bradyrhizobium arachidis]